MIFGFKGKHDDTKPKTKKAIKKGYKKGVEILKKEAKKLAK